jgi:hypothetical protein
MRQELANACAAMFQQQQVHQSQLQALKRDTQDFIHNNGLHAKDKPMSKMSVHTPRPEMALTWKMVEQFSAWRTHLHS